VGRVVTEFGALRAENFIGCFMGLFKSRNAQLRLLAQGNVYEF
jgi:hypothetical protein